MNIIIADDHVIVRRGLVQMIDTRPDWHVTADVASAEELFDVLRTGLPDILILDISFRERSGLDVLVQVRALYPKLPVLMMSMHPEEQYAMRAIRSGATGYVQKDRSIDEILDAISRVAAGRTYVSAAVAEQMAQDLTRTRRPGELHERLSLREFEVFRRIARGQSVTEIAEAMNLSVKTVSTYRARILEKTGLRSNADIIAYGIRAGIVELL